MKTRCLWLPTVLFLLFVACQTSAPSTPEVTPVAPAASEAKAETKTEVASKAEVAPKAEAAPRVEATEEPKAAGSEPWANTLKWATASEVDNFGYDVYRGESEEGPFERVTKEPIEGAGTTDEISRYVFVDDTIDPHKTYYYYVESISMEGVRERFTPVGKKNPKISPEEESGN